MLKRQYSAQEALPFTLSETLLSHPAEHCRVDSLSDYAMSLANKGDVDAAIECYRELMDMTSTSVDALYNLGILLIQKGYFEKAVSTLQLCLQKSPIDPSVLNNIAIAYLNMGQLTEASACLEKALNLCPEHKNALCNLGLVSIKYQRYDQAIFLLKRCIEFHPRHYLAYHLLGDVCKEIGKPNDAAYFYGAALKLKPNEPDIIVALASALTRAGRKQDALLCYQKAIECRPADYTLYNKYATVLEKCNRLGQARQMVEKSLHLSPNNYGAIVNLAMLEYRDSNYEAAHEHLKSLDIKGRTFETAATIRQLHGLVLDKLSRYGDAFRMFQEANQFEMQTPTYSCLKQDHQSDLSSLRETAALFTPQQIISWQIFPYTAFEKPPVFLVGFPRSGTTLMEQIINAHPQMVALDERTPLVDIIKDFSVPPDSERLLCNISRSDFQLYRNRYYNLLRERTNSTGSNMLPVDKMPLNILYLPQIFRFFPEAKIIVMLRHPLDCVISNFIQRFKLNVKMMNFLTLQNTAQFYDLTMGAYLEFRKTLPLAIHEIKYESLIENLEKETKDLTSFLETDWSPDMLHHQHKAARRIINTPSYTEVVKPVHHKARYRWKNYREQLSQVLPLVQKYIDRFDYSLEG